MNFWFRYNKTIYPLRSVDLGTLKWIRIEHDNKGHKPGWFLDKVIVENMNNGQVYTFICKQWLANGAISQDLYGKFASVLTAYSDTSMNIHESFPHHKV